MKRTAEMPRNLTQVRFSRNASMHRSHVNFTLKGGRGTVSLLLTLDEAKELLENAEGERLRFSFTLAEGSVRELAGQLVQLERRRTAR